MNKIVWLLFLLLLSLGYLSALINLYLTHEMADMQPGLTINDIRVHFHGSPTLTKLTLMINGPMRQYLDSDAEKTQIETWVAAGAKADDYLTVRPIFQDRCIRCHDLFGKAEFRPLTTFEEVSVVTKPSEGQSWQRLAKLSHQHFLGMALVFFGVLTVLFRNPSRMKLKLWLAAAAFMAVGGDILGWWLTKLYPIFAYLVAGFGAAHGMLFFFMVFLCVWDILGDTQTNTQSQK